MNIQRTEKKENGDEMTKKGIMIVGHGSRYGYNKKTMELQVERLTAMGFGNVYIGFNETSRPFIEDTLLEMAGDGIDEIIAIPFFIASGLHITRDIPPKLGLGDGTMDADVNIGGKKIKMHLGTPFGDDPLLARILHERVRELESGDRRTGVVIIGHGSKLPYNMNTIILNAERLTKMGHEHVRYAFNEFNEPKIEPTLDEMIKEGIDEIIVLPLFISLGDHLKNDVPEKIYLKDGVNEGSFDHNGKRITVKYALPIGQDPRLTDVIAEKIRKY
jgi:sirohydrochlorin cobaltochelatase